MEEALLFILGGILAGIVNTLSGSGSLFSLGVMYLTGIPLVLANIASRPGVLFQNMTAILVINRYYKLKASDIPIKPAFVCCLGAMIGAFCATRVSGELFNHLASGVMLILLLLYLFPATLRKMTRHHQFSFSSKTQLLLFLLTGFYGGFIQIGIGILVLTLLTGALQLPYAESNAYKLALILIYTLPTTIYFALNGQVLWKPALLLASGQVVGAYLAAVFIGKSQKAAFWGKTVTIMMIIATLVKVWFFS